MDRLLTGLICVFRIYEEFNNTGAGSGTANRLYETKAVASVSKSQLWGNGCDSWIDAS
jgi:pectinesterase